ncbi:hypothetical protein KAX97_13890, partial [candidate division WOR-3 bacterium]|nr:hypothetical protein [candidate division WOR-3 bacterium]
QPDKIVHREICTTSGESANKYCDNTIDEIFVAGTEPKTECQYHTQEEPLSGNLNSGEFIKPNSQNKSDFVIFFPDDGDIFKIDPVLRKEYQILKLQIQYSYQLKEIRWFIDDELIGSVAFPYTITWQLSPGNHQIVARGLTQNNIKLESPPVSISVLEISE